MLYFQLYFYLFSKCNDIITIKELALFIESNSELYKPFFLLKLSLINHFFSERYFGNVIKRIMYYDSPISRYSSEADESCLHKMYRIIILKEPPLYYTEYREYDTDPKECEDLFDLFILNRRIKYGYSKRLGRSTCRSNASDSNSMRSSSHQSSKIIMVTPKRSNVSFNQTV